VINSNFLISRIGIVFQLQYNKLLLIFKNIVNIIVAPILPTNLSKYLIQSRYTPSGSDRQKIRVQFSLPVKVNVVKCSIRLCSVRLYKFCMLKDNVHD